MCWWGLGPPVVTLLELWHLSSQFLMPCCTGVSKARNATVVMFPTLCARKKTYPNLYDASIGSISAVTVSATGPAAARCWWKSLPLSEAHTHPKFLAGSSVPLPAPKSRWPLAVAVVVLILGIGEVPKWVPSLEQRLLDQSGFKTGLKVSMGNLLQLGLLVCWSDQDCWHFSVSCSLEVLGPPAPQKRSQGWSHK